MNDFPQRIVREELMVVERAKRIEAMKQRAIENAAKQILVEKYADEYKALIEQKTGELEADIAQARKRPFPIEAPASAPSAPGEVEAPRPRK